MAAVRFCRSLLQPGALARRSVGTSAVRPAAAAWSGSSTTYSHQCNHRDRNLLPPSSHPTTNLAVRARSGANVKDGAPAFKLGDYEHHSLLLLKAFEKVDESKVTLDAHFKHDLGLDSLDHVEIILVIEDYFMVHIPDHEAEMMFTLRQIVDYMIEFDEVDKPQYIYPHRKAPDTPEI